MSASKKEKEEADEEPLCIPRQDYDDDDDDNEEGGGGGVDSSNKRLIEMLASAQQRETQLRALLAQEQRNRPLARVHPNDVERVYMQRQPWWWFALLALSVICVFGTYSKGRIISTVVNVIGHKMIWRRLYVQTAPSAMLFATLVIVYTLYFV